MNDTKMDSLRAMDCVFYRNINKVYPVIDHGQGICLYDVDGNEYLDFGAGIAVVNIGYSVPEVIQAMTEQSKRASFIYSAPFTNEPQIRLSKKIIDLAPKDMAKVIFISGGSEAIETAIKLARQYHLEKGNESKYRIVARWTSYHGNTLGALSASGRTLWREYFTPYLQNFIHIYPPYCYRCPYGRQYPECGITCAHELERVIKYESARYISAFIAEPVIGTSATGVTPPPEYYPIIREICDRYDILFICDEVISGLGRTGAGFGIEHWGVSPDIIVTGKGLGGGYTPLAAVIVSESVFDTFASGTRGHTQGYTYAGNPLSAAIGLSVLDYVETHRLIERVSNMEAYLRKKLDELKLLGIVGDVRGKGFLFGVEFVESQTTKAPFPKEYELTRRIVEAALERKLMVIGGMGGMVDGVLGDHLQITPSFIITEKEIDRAVDTLADSIEQVKKDLNIQHGSYSG
jgi:adenosylmethionine-8-amino-7-oxononanoate aminotransferase